MKEIGKIAITIVIYLIGSMLCYHFEILPTWAFFIGFMFCNINRLLQALNDNED